MEIEQSSKKYGLLGKQIDYSFSRAYFKAKFEREGLTNCNYENFDLKDRNDIPKLLKRTDLNGINVTIPYKKEVLKHLDFVDSKAQKIGAVNTVIWNKKGQTTGYNTDVYGFEKSLKEQHHSLPKKALILGTGGAAEAVIYVLNENDIDTATVSRDSKRGDLTYENLTQSVMENHLLIVNTTPLGTFPNVEKYPPIPYQFLTSNHSLFDLIYNPEQTTFLKKGKEKGTQTQNGYDMLVYQAEKSWELWNH